MALCACLVSEMTGLEEKGKPVLSLLPENNYLVIARFACGIILHMQLQQEVESGLDNMKFAVNHFYRFEKPWIAFLAGFL